MLLKFLALIQNYKLMLHAKISLLKLKLVKQMKISVLKEKYVWKLQIYKIIKV